MFTLLFDGACPLCKSLAELVAARAPGKVLIQSWQECPHTFSHTMNSSGRETGEQGEPSALSPLKQQRPNSIGVLTNNQLYTGADAWEILLEELPDLRFLNWLAIKLGISRQVAKSLALGGHAARRLCLRCPR